MTHISRFCNFFCNDCCPYDTSRKASYMFIFTSVSQSFDNYSIKSKLTYFFVDEYISKKKRYFLNIFFKVTVVTKVLESLMSVRTSHWSPCSQCILGFDKINNPFKLLKYRKTQMSDAKL